MLDRMASFASRRARWIVAAALSVAVAAAVLGAGVTDRLADWIADDPDTEATQADTRLGNVTDLDNDNGVAALIRPGVKIRSAEGRERVAEVTRLLAADKDVGLVISPFKDRLPTMISTDGRAAFVFASLDKDARRRDVVPRLEESLRGQPGVQLGGPGAIGVEANETVEEDLRRGEIIAFPLLLILSFWFFRSLVASLLPLLIGGMTIVLTFLALKIATGFTDVSIFAINLTIGLGVGLALDYSLFMVARYREEIAAEGPTPAALARTLRSAGRTVLFSSLTVAAAMSSLLVFPQNFLYSMGFGGVVVALLSGLVALSVIPAFLALLGTRVNALAPRRLRRAVEAEARPATSGFWYRLSRFVQRRAAVIAAASGVALVLVALPFADVRFTSADARVLPSDRVERQVDEYLRAEFSPSHQVEPLIVSTYTGDMRAVRRFADQVAKLPGVEGVLPPVRHADDLIRVDAVSSWRAFDPRSQDLLRDIRAIDAPFEFGISGETGTFVDMQTSLGNHLPLALGILGVATFVLLFAMTGSVVLPVKAFVMNLLTLGATFGILVMIFQWGNLQGLLDFEAPGALEISQPLVLAAVVFGLSTDYGVFLLTRIKEARDRGASDSESVALGLERTGRIVTAAALLFTVAIGAFATSQIVFIKELGLGMALAVLIDATIVRALLVPSLMQLMGRWNWWAPCPGWTLDRSSIRAS